MLDGKAMGQQILEAVQSYVSRAVGELSSKLIELEGRIKAIPVGRDGKDGERGPPGESIRGEKGEKGDSGEAVTGPKGDKGDPGPHGERGDVGRAGERGEKGETGSPGLDGKSITVNDVLPEIKQWFEALPRPADGRDGADGKSITVSDVSEFMEASMAKWALEFERRAFDHLNRCIDRIEKPKDGAPGKDGRDALGFDEAVVEHDGERSITLAFVRGDQRKEFPLKLPVVIERGVFKEGVPYERGDGVTWAGSYWIALTDTSSKPGDGNADWRLAVKKGRDGRDGLPGQKGDPGKDARQRSM